LKAEPFVSFQATGWAFRLDGAETNRGGKQICLSTEIEFTRMPNLVLNVLYDDGFSAKVTAANEKWAIARL